MTIIIRNNKVPWDGHAFMKHVEGIINFLIDFHHAFLKHMDFNHAFMKHIGGFIIFEAMGLALWIDSLPYIKQL